MNSKQKVLDIQGIRGLSIIAVLGFHFYPIYFPNGYLGVDQFFVISGFLMCMLLSKSSINSNTRRSIFSIVTTFYSRRLRRILPLYFFFIASTLFGLYQFFPGVGKLANFHSAPRALFFYSNQPKSHRESYFEELQVAVDVFTHTWSLSVEIQFYLIIPFLFIIGSYLSTGKRYFYYFLLATTSFILNFKLPTNVSFNSMFARIWQFLIGMCVYLYQAKETTENKPKTSCVMAPNNKIDIEESPLISINITNLDLKKENGQTGCSFVRKLVDLNVISYIFLIFCCAVTLSPFKISAEVVRPLVTFFTGFLILFSKNNILLSNKLISYIGDISYSLYLVHWPFYSHWKLLSSNQNALLAYLLFSIIVAIAVFETYEKWYLQLTNQKVGVLILVLLLVDSILIFEGQKAKASVNVNKVFSRDDYDAKLVEDISRFMTRKEIYKVNSEWNLGDEANLMYNECVPPNDVFSGVCDTTGLKPSAPLKIYVFGNSWAANQYRLIYDECSSMANSIRLASDAGCEPFTVNSIPTRCPDYYRTLYFDAVKELQPDYAFYINRVVTFGEPLDNNATDEVFYQPAEKELLAYLPYVKKKIFILKPLVDFDLDEFKNLKNTLLEGVLTKEQIDNHLIVKNDYQEIANERFERLFKACGGKCEAIDYNSEFWNNQTNNYRFYDSYGLQYINQGLHLTPHGLQKVRHLYTSICEKLV